MSSSDRGLAPRMSTIFETGSPSEGSGEREGEQSSGQSWAQQDLVLPKQFYFLTLSTYIFCKEILCCSFVWNYDNVTLDFLPSLGCFVCTHVSKQNCFCFEREEMSKQAREGSSNNTPWEEDLSHNLH